MERERRRRRRAALTCVECRRRKIKCDRKNPCGHCVSTNTQCTFQAFKDEPERPPADPGQERLPQARGSLSPSSSRLPGAADSHREELRQRSQQSETSPVAHKAALVSPNVGGAANQKQPQTPKSASVLHYLATKDTAATKPPVQPADLYEIESGRSILETQLGLEPGNIIMNKTRTLRSSDWIGVAKEFSCINSCLRAVTDEGTDRDGVWFQDEETKAFVSEIGVLMNKCKHLTRSLKVEKPSRDPLPPLSDSQQPTRDAADQMVDLYLEFFESVIRVFHIPTFRSEYQSYKDSPETANSVLRLKVLLVIGLGSSLRPPDPKLRIMIQRWISEAQSWLSGPLEKDRLSIDAIQVYCLTLLARQIFTVGGDLVWISMGGLIHMAMQMGLHRDPRHLPAMTHLQAEIRRRLWATIIELAAQSSLDTAMLPRISFDEFDTESPANIDDQDLDESTLSLEPYITTAYTHTSTQLLLLDSLPIRWRILHLLNGLNSQIYYKDVLHLSAQLANALERCAQFLRENNENGRMAFRGNMLDMLVRRFMIPLNCIFASKARENPLFQSSLKICLDTSLALLPPEPDASFSRLLVVAGGLFREGLRYACGILAFEVIAETESQRRDGTLHRSSGHREVVLKAIRDLVSLAADRIHQGENNVKMHVIMNMIIAQVEAVGRGLPVEYDVAKAGVESLLLCCGLLEERMSALPTLSLGWEMALRLDVESDEAWTAESFAPTAAFL